MGGGRALQAGPQQAAGSLQGLEIAESLRWGIMG